MPGAEQLEKQKSIQQRLKSKSVYTLYTRMIRLQCSVGRPKYVFNDAESYRTFQGGNDVVIRKYDVIAAAER